MKIDFHTHILPGIDDGARSQDMAEDMLKKLHSQGVDTVVLTPHYYSHQRPIDEFSAEQQEVYRRFCSSLTDRNVKIFLGSEVYFSDYLFNNRDLSPLCIQGTKLILLELPYNKTVDTRMIDKIDRLIGEYDLRPIIAHVERYPSLLRSTRSMDRLLDIGCVLQVNLSSFTTFGKRRLISLVKNGYIGVLGTDAHNLSNRPAEYNEGYRYLEKSVSSRMLKDIQASMASLLCMK